MVFETSQLHDKEVHSVVLALCDETSRHHCMCTGVSHWGMITYLWGIVYAINSSYCSGHAWGQEIIFIMSAVLRMFYEYV